MDTTATSPRVRTSSSRTAAVNLLAQVWPWIFLLVMVAFFSIFGTGFFSIRSAANILVTSTLVMLMAIGQTYVIITAGIDLSIGWTVGLASVVSATVMRDLALGGMSNAPAMALGVLAGLLVSIVPGVINGVLIAKVKVPPFITTLGMYGIVRGAAFLLTDGQSAVAGLPPELRSTLTSLGNGSLIYNLPGEGITFFSPPADLAAQQLRILQRLLPYPVLIVAIVVVIFAFILARTLFGRHTYAIGGNPDAARRAGINVDRHLIMIYVLSSFTAAIAGILHVFRFTTGSPSAGEEALLDSVAAVVIGGTSLFGGAGRLQGTVVGALTISVVQIGLTSMNVDPIWKFVVVGVIIIVAVFVNQIQAYLEKQREHA
ncbi:MAG: ABC transporter permease [bacterium]|nr:ABC transporter permease [bacterium]